MIYDTIKDFPKQFEFEPKIENAVNLRVKNKFVVCGMGGSNNASMIIKSWKPETTLVIHKDYGLPVEASSPDYLTICSSYSGTTEETIDSLKEALKNNLPVAVIATGGTIIEIAKENNVPYVLIPKTGIQPRTALGYSLKSFLKLMFPEQEFPEVVELSRSLNSAPLEKEGKKLGETLKGFVPIVYASNKNLSIAYNWKIKMNETGKVPTFYNLIPELNHNEMNGFDVKEATKELSNHFYFLLLSDSEDSPKIRRRMAVLEQLYKDRDLKVIVLNLHGDTRLLRIFNSILLADWVSFYTSQSLGLESEQVPMVEEFKKLI
ncbi:MAG: SIS domain-containing protein [Patescibacteria group bacterium]|mgnify:CR=1 FL=1